MSAPLEDVSVLDLTRLLPGNYAAYPQEGLAEVLASSLDDPAPLATTRALLDDGVAFDRRTRQQLYKAG